MIATEKEILENSLKVRTATHSGSWIVTPSFIYQSVACNRKVDEWDHLIINRPLDPHLNSIVLSQRESEEELEGLAAFESERESSILGGKYRNVDHFLQTNFATAFQNVVHTFSEKVLEKVVEDAVSNISKVCAFIIGQRHPLSGDSSKKTSWKCEVKWFVVCF